MSEIRWVYSDYEHTFGLFQALFEKLGLANAFSFVGQMTLFSGFLVIRQSTRKSHFHADFGDTGGKAFTLMTPLDEMSDLEACHLLAKLPRSVGGDGNGNGDGGGGCGGGSGEVASDASAIDDGACDVRQYRYEFGRGICFGDGFVHATETGDSPRPLAFLCFTFGDRMLTDEQWQSAEAYISQQGPIYQDPKGKLVVSNTAGKTLLRAPTPIITRQ